MKAWLILLLAAGPLWGGEITYQYALWVSSFGNVGTARGLFGARGYSSNPQPVRISQVLLAANTNYALVTYTPLDASQKLFVDNLETLGQVRLVRSLEIINDPNPRIGTYVDIKDIAPFPKEFNTPWIAAQVKPQ